MFSGSFLHNFILVWQFYIIYFMSKFNSFACQNPIVLPLKYPIHEYNMWYIGKKKDLQEIGYD